MDAEALAKAAEKVPQRSAWKRWRFEYLNLESGNLKLP